MSSIQRRPTGRWRARYRDEAGHEHSRHFDRKVDAKQWLDQITTAMVTGAYVDPRAGRQTFHAFYAAWAPRQVWESTTVKAMQLATQSVTFGDIPLGRLRRSHIETWIKLMAQNDLAPGTIRTRVNNVRAVLRAAVRDRIIANDPSQGVPLPRDRRREAAMALPSASQVAAIFQAAEEPFRAFVAVAAFAGLRLGEAAALQVGDIDFSARQLRVHRQVQRADLGKVEIRPPKYRSERTVYLADALLEILAEHVERHSPGPALTRWLFRGSGDEPPHQNTVGHRWRTACRAAGVTGVTLHDMRHFYASGLIASGCDVVTVQRALGHAKATTTLNTYAHLWPTAEDRTRKAAGDLLATVLDGSAELFIHGGAIPG